MRSNVSQTIPVVRYSSTAKKRREDPHHLDERGGEQRDVEDADGARVQQPRRHRLQVLLLSHVRRRHRGGGGGARAPRQQQLPLLAPAKHAEEPHPGAARRADGRRARTAGRDTENKDVPKHHTTHKFATLYVWVPQPGAPHRRCWARPAFI
eukprot:scaffold19247_cov135-Isochrysis_galbana.AAC.1